MANIIDLDKIIKEDRDAAIDQTSYIKMKLFGDEFRVTTNPNVYTSLAAGSGDPNAIASLLTGMLHTDDRDNFKNKLMGADGINAEVLLKILNAMLEAVAERPTKSPSGSSRGRKATPASKAKSEQD